MDRFQNKSGFAIDSDPYGPPPSYDKAQAGTGSKWAPKNWTKKTMIAVAIGVCVLIAVIIIAAVLGSRAASGSYPDYSPLNYTLKDTYHGTDFFDNFNYFTGYDPTSGFVHYVPNTTAQQYNLTYAGEDSAVLRVDYNSGTDSSTGRFSVRVTSKQTYDEGLFIFDVLHSPYGCSTWPALWLSDPSNWPENGEIDVMESVNQGNTGNQMTLHTSKHCKMDVKRKETGDVLDQNCYAKAGDQQGCGVQGSKQSFGEAFNNIGGGVYAMEWRNEGIRVWFFPRGSVPSDIPTDVSNTSAPDPSTWGEATADFPGTNCDISSHFRNQSIIANIDLCGTWAGQTSVYSDEWGCPGQCTDFVANNASAYEKAYWEFSSFRVYQAN
ncbi:putative endo-1,3(4)-beta-glucanase [Hortaea werneckii]|uniref:endo-1,3(4)-beta-glucanase n=1 Tax=Hortaea werneckii TaxID=91943 RepID=A0A3M7FRM0_HORWE|nr:putative endo-1,3(4)-beta-glucanase [Hortaea werneckii]RMY91499.1 hypothetical protein D0861_03091 [Hortaea werneckii]